MGFEAYMALFILINSYIFVKWMNAIMVLENT